jgi:hypothetical protein
MSQTSRLILFIFAVAILGCGSAAEDAGRKVKVVFLHFDGESVVFELDGETVFDRVLTTQDHSVGVSHVEPLTLNMKSTFKWTVDGREYEQRLEVDPSIGVVYITLGQPLVDLGAGDELLLD